MWVPLHFEETSNPPQLDSFVGSCRSISFHRSSFFLYGTWIRCLHLGLCFWCLVQVIPILMVGDARIRIVPVCRTNEDHCSPPRWFQFGICPPNFKFELGQLEPNWTAISPDRDLADVWFDPAWFDPPLRVLLKCVRIISITATRVNVGFAMFVSFWYNFDSAASIWG